MSTFTVNGSTLNPQQTYALARYAGFKPSDAVDAAGIALGFSRGVTNTWDTRTGQLGMWGTPYIDPSVGLVPGDTYRAYGSADAFAQSPARQASAAYDAFKRGGIDALRVAGLDPFQEAVGRTLARIAAFQTPDSEVPDIVGGIQAGLNQSTPPQVGTMATSTSGTAPVADTNNWNISLTPMQRPSLAMGIPNAAFNVPQYHATAHAMSTLGIAALIGLAIGAGYLLWRSRGSMGVLWRG